MDIMKLLGEIVFLFLEMAPYIMLGLLFVGILSLFFKKDMIIKHIGRNDFSSIFKAALFGVPLPLCSCGVVPTSVYLSKSGASKSSVISFLISTPQTGIDSIIATYGMMGWLFAIFRPIVALIMGIIGGIVIKFVNVAKIDNKKDTDINFNKISSFHESDSTKTPIRKVLIAGNYAFGEFLDDISAQFVVGLIIAGILSYIIPDDFFAGIGLNQGILGMLIMIIVGIPMYVCATASIPIAITLMMKGFSPGLAFVFLVTGPATNAASISILFNVLGKKVTTVYLAVIIISAIIFGYILDGLFHFFMIEPMQYLKHIHSHDSMLSMDFKIVISLIFLILLLLSFYRKYFVNLISKKGEVMEKEQKTKILIEGMTCNHCVMNVKRAAMSVAGIKNVEVDLNEKAAFVEGSFDFKSFRKAIEDIGYHVISSN